LFHPHPSQACPRVRPDARSFGWKPARFPAVQLRLHPFAHNGVARRRTLVRLGSRAVISMTNGSAALPSLRPRRAEPAESDRHPSLAHGALASFFWPRTARPGVLVAKEIASLRSPSRNCADAVITSKSDPIGRRGVWSPTLPTGYVERPFGRIPPT